MRGVDGARNGEAQAIVQALHRRGMSDGAIAAVCGLGRVTVYRIRHGEQSGRNSLAALRAIAEASMPDQFGPVELELPALSRSLMRGPHASPGREASRQRARIVRDIERNLANARTAPPPAPRSMPPAPPVTPDRREGAARQIGRMLGIDVPASRPDGLLDTSELRTSFTGAPLPSPAQHIAPRPRAVERSGAVDRRAGVERGPWCDACPYRPAAPRGTPEYAMQRVSFSCPYYNGQGCQRP